MGSVAGQVVEEFASHGTRARAKQASLTGSFEGALIQPRRGNSCRRQQLPCRDVAGIVDVPEPASLAMMLAGFGLVGAAMRNRQKVAVSFGRSAKPRDRTGALLAPSVGRSNGVPVA